MACHSMMSLNVLDLSRLIPVSCPPFPMGSHLLGLPILIRWGRGSLLIF